MAPEDTAPWLSDIDILLLTHAHGDHISSESLLLILNDILDMSKIEAGKLVINYSPVNVFKTIDEIYQLFKINTDKKGIRFSYSVQDYFPEYIIFSEVYLRQILFNLIGNAVKFTSKGLVSVEVGFEEGKESEKFDFFIKIKDTGVGIETHDIDKIFHPFIQLSNSTNTKGTGLGLTITKRLVESLGGLISVESEPRKGTCFTIRFNSITKTFNNLTSTSGDKKITVAEKSNVKTLFFTNGGDDSTKLFEFLNKVTKPVIKVENDLSAAREAIKDIDLAVLCGSNDNQLKNSYKVLSQTLGSDKLWFILLSKNSRLFQSISNPMHIVINNSPKELEKLLNSLLYDITNKKEISKLTTCINVISQNPKVKLEFKNKIIPLFNDALESKLMSNINKFSASLKAIALKYHIDSMIEFSEKLDKNIQNFNINEIDNLLIVFSNNCKNNLEL